MWKLLYIYMLGYTSGVEFGHRQACDLIPAAKYSEKQVGYMACSILLNERVEFLRLSINAIHNDLTSRNEAFQCLALAFVSNSALRFVFLLVFCVCPLPNKSPPLSLSFPPLSLSLPNYSHQTPNQQTNHQNSKINKQSRARRWPRP